MSNDDDSLTIAEIRLNKDLKELSCFSFLQQISRKGPYEYHVEIVPTEGMYIDTKLNFAIIFKPTYPFDPPRVVCITTGLFHPNVDEKGNVCLNILRLDWSPVFTIETIILAINTLLIEPSPEDALNKEAASMLLEKGEEEFKRYLFSRNTQDMN